KARRVYSLASRLPGTNRLGFQPSMALSDGSYLGRNSDACAGNIYLSADRWWDYYGEHVDLSSPTDE
ncbi:MAG: hypothetical protein KZQ72_03155, partial [Candidatus Thiodiazotropha sp. (ex Cardiolucina cf. quadrata)]|nr:hypothetical protein [Candidatus Thiodiazotropha sp. (ex Cardiolucina cf. quadrata)]